MQISLQKKSTAARTADIAAWAKPLAIQLGACGAAFLLARAPMLDGLRPLALAFCTGCPAASALLACAGAAAGYALQGTLAGFAPYLAAVVLLAMVRTIKKDLSALMLCLTAAGLYLAAGSAMAFALHTGAAAIAGLVSESLIIGGTGYLLHSFFAQPWQGFALLGSRGRASLGMACMVLVIGLAPYKLWYLHPVHILAGLLCLFAACRGREGTGAVFGVACAVAIMCADTKLLYAGIAIATGSLVVGLFIPQHRLAAAVTYAASGLVGVMAAPSFTDGVLLITELLFTAALFLALPPSLFLATPAAQETTAATAAGAQLAGRLTALSSSLVNVGQTVNDVCARIPKVGDSPEDLCSAVADSVCKHCKRCLFCWVTKYDETMECLQRLLPQMADTAITAQDLPPLLACRCVQPVRLANGFNSQYAAYTARRSVRTRNEMMRAALTEQYSVLATSLAHLAERIDDAGMPDPRRSARVDAALRTVGIVPLETLVLTADTGLVRVCVRTTQAVAAPAALTQDVSRAAQVQLSPPQAVRSGGVTTLTFLQRCIFTAQFGLSSVAAGEGICADAARFFTTEQGTAHAVLCEGMGTGKEAAIDGNMAANFTAELLEAGFGCMETARLVNVALSLKSDEDASAGVDLLSVNLYDGKATIFKAGGAPSYFIRNGKVSSQTSQGLPIGILGGVMGRSGTFTLFEGDTVVFVSDGAVAEGGEAWLGRLLAMCANEDPQQMANHAVREARARVQQPDDITVLVMRLQKA